MVETVRGLILRETTVGESDKIMTVLTAEKGRISVFASGAKRLKSPLFAATQLFSYSELTVFHGRESYSLRQGDLIESFFHMRDTLEGAALAGYLADVCADISLEGEPEEKLMRLLLNSYHAIANRLKPMDQIKAVFELRATAEAGFLPNLVACAGCGESVLDTYYFDVADGVFRCDSCYRAASAEAALEAERQNEIEGIYPAGHTIALLSPSVFVAMRYAVYSRPERMFAFELQEDALRDFAAVCEQYALCHLERGFSTLDFYHKVKGS